MIRKADRERHRGRPGARRCIPERGARRCASGPRCRASQGLVARAPLAGAAPAVAARRSSRCSCSAPGPACGSSRATCRRSLTLGVLPLTDPFVLAQTVAARHWPELSALIGAAIVHRLLRARRRARFLRLGVPGQHGDRRCRLAAPPSSGSRRPRTVARAAATGCSSAVLVASAVTGVAGLGMRQPGVDDAARHRSSAAALAWTVPLRRCSSSTCSLRRTAGAGTSARMGAIYGLIGRASLLRVSARHAQPLQRLRRLLCRLPRTPGDRDRRSRARAVRPGDRRRRLHQLRTLHRRVRPRRVPIHPPIRSRGD